MVCSSQLPVGSVARLEHEACGAGRHGRRVSVRLSPGEPAAGQGDRGVHPARSRRRRRPRPDGIATILTALFAPITDRMVWMSVESAEMTKHAINAFLATSVAFINEIAALCERVGADATEVSQGLKSDQRIGPKAYLAPGGAFAGGTLARDVVLLERHGRGGFAPDDRSSPAS